MRKLVVGALGVLLLAVAAALGVLFVPSPLQKWAAERGASMATGREVTFGEPFRLRAWPPLEIAASDVRVANAGWGSAPELATIAALDAKVDLMAFWRAGRVQVDRLVVTRPQVNLEVGQDGKRNWELGGGDVADGSGAPDDRRGEIPPFVLSDVRVEDGSVGYDDRAAGTSRRAEAIALAIAQAGPDQPVAIDGGLTLDGRRATLTGAVDRPQGAAAGERSPIRLALGLPGATASFDGAIETKAPAAAGAIDVKVAAARELLAWVGVPPPEALPGSAALQGRVDLTSARVALDELRLQADRLSATGRAAVDMAEPPRVTGEIALGRLDLSPYLAPARGNGAAAATPAKADGGWPDTPVVLPLPLPVDLDLRLRGDGLKAGTVEVGAFDTRLQSDRTQATATVDALQAYGGGLTGKLRAEPGAPPAYAVEINADGVGVLAASQALAGLSRVDGRAVARLALASRGGSVRDLVGGLGGDGRVTVRDGAVLGVNIAGMLRQVMTLGLDAGATRQQRTDFAEAGFSFKAENGTLRTQDLHLKAPVLRLDGAGAVDLPRLTIDMRVVPKLASTLQGQGAKGEPAFQAGIPFVIQGPYASPSVRFDLDGTLTSAISGPQDIARLAADLAKSPQAVQVLRDQFDLLGKLPAPAAGKAIEAVQGALGKARQSGGSDLGKAARGLLEGFGRR